ncbi:MAG: carboxypeptidase regulatory-like domain-containing protein [Acidimicrobiia bacterium]|nr:carboxypeptidase regulatory-like domain-containing protein [Acidimicrobiia bacterium]
MKRTLFVLAAAALVTWTGTAALRGAQQTAVPIDADDIGGVVRGPGGPEAGVWVIAETADLPTKFRKIVVTDEAGRYVVPDLPKANYRVWVRGYGLVDSPAVQAQPGRQLALTAVPAPDARAAAEYYPASYWLSLVNVPPASAFPLPDPPASGSLGAAGPPPRAAQNQHEWIAQLKAPCQTCHQMGTKATREIPRSLGVFDSGFAAWDRRLRAGQFGRTHQNLNVFGGYQRGAAMYADWTDRIAAGEVPPAPPRPRGVERNVVITLWDHSGPLAFVHDVIATDRRNPRINANGIVYGGEFNYNALTAVDPLKHTAELIDIPAVVDKGRIRRMAQQTMEFPSPYWGEEVIWQEWAQPNNLIIDQENRVWTLATMRPPEENPAYCFDGTRNAFARAWPQKAGGRQLAMYDPRTKRFTHVDTCFNLHHIVLAEDRDNTIFATGNGSTIGWINTRVFLETRDAEKAQGWCPAYYDVNGDGRIDPAVDKRVEAGSYGLGYNPVDGSVWFASLGTPGKIVRLVRGANPPATCVYEAYEPPFNNPKAPGKIGFFPRGLDVDRTGVVWTALAGSGHIASFDRSKCAVLTGEAATTGQHCPEGWTLYSAPGARFKGTSVTDDVNAEFFYYNWVDQFDTFGLGPNTPLATGTGSDSLMAVLPRTGDVVTFRVPYPMGGFFARSMDGRIDNPNTGWKGRGLWAPNASRPTWHQETGKGSPSFVAHFQLRPDPLAK